MSLSHNLQVQSVYSSLVPVFFDDVEFFADFVFGSKLRPKQIEFCKTFKDHKQITFKGGVGFGKTHALAILVWWSLFTHDQVQVTIFGPNEGQIKSGIWKELQILHGRMEKQFQADWDFKGTRIERIFKSADCFAEFRLANKDNVASTRGIHQVNNFVFVDEATGVEEEVFTGSLINILTDPNPKLCLISNPSSTGGYFYRTWNDELISGDWAKVHGRMADNPTVTPQLIAQMAGQYGGVTSREYRIMVEGEFPLDDSDGLISREMVELAVNNADAIPASNRPIIWGVDPAGDGMNADRSVLVKRHDNKVLEDPQEWRGLDPIQLAHRIRDEYNKASSAGLRPKWICVDAIGVGNGVAARLKEFGLPVKWVKVSNKPTRVEEFVKLRDQLWWECREWFHDGNVSIPNNTKLIEELLTPRYNTDSGKTKVEGKAELRRRMRGSPDYADALCLTFAVTGIANTSSWDWSKKIDYGSMRWAE